MSDKSLQVKSDFLGIPYGTAGGRLRKLLLFKYVKKAGEINCWDCGEEILTPEEMSIQHKSPWLHASRNLFWDLDNIVFSHSKCNTPNRNRNAEKTHCPQGHPYSGSNLVFRKGKWGLKRACKACELKSTRDRMRIRRKTSPEKWRK